MHDVSISVSACVYVACAWVWVCMRAHVCAACAHEHTCLINV